MNYCISLKRFSKKKRESKTAVFLGLYLVEELSEGNHLTIKVELVFGSCQAIAAHLFIISIRKRCDSADVVAQSLVIARFRRQTQMVVGYNLFAFAASTEQDGYAMRQQVENLRGHSSLDSDCQRHNRGMV